MSGLVLLLLLLVAAAAEQCLPGHDSENECSKCPINTVSENGGPCVKYKNCWCLGAEVSMQGTSDKQRVCGKCLEKYQNYNDECYGNNKYVQSRCLEKCDYGRKRKGSCKNKKFSVVHGDCCMLPCDKIKCGPGQERRAQRDGESCYDNMGPCKACEAGNFYTGNDLEDGGKYYGCKTHTNCWCEMRKTIVKGSAIADAICGGCLSGFTENNEGNCYDSGGGDVTAARAACLGNALEMEKQNCWCQNKMTVDGKCGRCLVGFEGNGGGTCKASTKSKSVYKTEVAYAKLNCQNTLQTETPVPASETPVPSSETPPVNFELFYYASLVVLVCLVSCIIFGVFLCAHFRKQNRQNRERHIGPYLYY